MVGSLFSNRPRVTGSNCKISCFACTDLSAGGFSSFCGATFFCGATVNGSCSLRTGGDGGVASAARGPSHGILAAKGPGHIDAGSGAVCISGPGCGFRPPLHGCEAALRDQP